MKQPIIMAIDTSCDETSVAISKGRQILSNIVSSQIDIHKKWGGVVPHLAKRAHQDKIEAVVNEALQRAFQGSKLAKKSKISNLSAIAVTLGPGLAPALEVGLDYAKKLAKKHQKPLITINHMEAHLLSSLALNSKGKGNFLKDPAKNAFPMLGLLVSGGHTQLILVKNIGNYEILGETLDDAAGEALDKLAKMLKLGYPGGPIIEEMAKKGDPGKIDLPVPMQHRKSYDFSFSGLKTAALYKIQKAKITKTYTYDMAASFQQAISISLTTKLKRAIEEFTPKAILLGGGVISNLYIRNQIRSLTNSLDLPLHLPYSNKLLTDNAAMICIPAYFKFLKKDFVKNINKLDRLPTLSFTNRL